MKTKLTSYRKYNDDYAREAIVETNKKKRKTIIKTVLRDIDYGRAINPSEEGYITKIKLNKAGKIKKSKTRKMGGFKASKFM